MHRIRHPPVTNVAVIAYSTNSDGPNNKSIGTSPLASESIPKLVKKEPSILAKKI